MDKLIRHIKFPIQFNAEKLNNELKQILNLTWVKHYNSQDYEGDWSLLSLMSENGNPASIMTNDVLKKPLQATPLLATCPYIKEILDFFAFEKTAVRLMRLAIGANIKPHTDNCLGYENNVFRLHIPLLTNPDVNFILDGERLPMNVGECWYINANFTHQVSNAGNCDRIHLVIDGIRNDWSDELFFAQAKQQYFEKPVSELDLKNLRMMIQELQKQDSPTTKILLEESLKNLEVLERKIKL